MYGVEVYYLPRKYVTEKTIIREVIKSVFDGAYPIEAYLENYEGYNENAVLMSKFGIQQTQEVNLIISKDRWESYIQPLIQNEPDIKLTTRPKEGDLLYFPLGDRLFEIKYVEHEKPYYQLQKNYVYELRCELFRFENEILDTGVENIDDLLIGGESDGLTSDSLNTIVGNTQILTLIGTGVTAIAEASLADGAIRFISVTNRGGGYTSTPRVAISSSPSGGVTGIATAIMIGGIVVCTDNVNTNAKSVQQVSILNPGSGYVSPPGVRFIGGGGSGAAATVGIATTGAVGIVTLTSGGSGYSTTPTVTFSTPKHVGAAATAILDSPLVGGGVSVVSAVISIGASAYLFPGGTTGGAFYKTAPTVTFSLPTGTGNAAEATATLSDFNQTGGTVETLAITTGGKFYSSVPTVTISHPGTVAAAATVSLSVGTSSINPNSVAFSTTGRAYTSAPTVTIGLGTGTVTPTTAAVGIATINSITGVVTAVSFNVSDAWAVGTGATIGLGYTVTPTLSFSSPSPVRATATVTVSVAGTINTISIANSGFGYLSTPTVTIDAPSGADENFRALGIATIRVGSISTEGTLGIGSTEITGITTTGIIVGDRIRLQSGYDASYNFIPAETFVTSIGIGSISISRTPTNVGIATSVFEFGIDQCGIVTGIAVTFGGGGYLTPPTITITNEVSEKNYVEIIPGISTATGIATVNSSGVVSEIRITDAGFGYVLAPEITISDPSLDSTGDFIFNEIVTGSISGATARVRTWNSTTNSLNISNVTGTFVIGENIVGSDSGASHGLRVVSTDPLDDGFADNATIESEADAIIDFSERNPFGIP